MRSIPRHPRRLAGRGIVLCGWGENVVERALKLLAGLREAGCELPAQLWLPGAETDSFAAELETHQAELVNPSRIEGRNPAPLSHPWTLKAHAILHSGFRETLLFDVPPVPPTRRKKANGEHRSGPLPKTGALFWPGRKTLFPPSAQHRCAASNKPWTEFDSGRMILDVARCWRPLHLWRWFNEHPYYFHHLADGEMGTLQFAFRLLRQPFTLVPRRCRSRR